MKNLIKFLRMPLCFIVVIGAVALPANLTLADEHHHSKRGSTGTTNPSPTPPPAVANRKSTGPTKPTAPPHLTDLREKIAQMKLKDGNNVIYTEGGVNLMAKVKGGQITGYGATDKNGKPLVTTMEQKGGGTPACRITLCITTRAGRVCIKIPCPPRKT